MNLISGVDACKGGWICIFKDLVSGEVVSEVYRLIVQLVDRSPRPEVLALDIPIGLTNSGPRECDIIARRLLGHPRRSSVFPAAIRPALEAQDRKQADEITRSIDGRGVGAQAFGLYARIREVDAIMRSYAQARGRIYEVHPELCFMAWNGGKPIKESKKSHLGMSIRQELIQSPFGKRAMQFIRQAHQPSVVADDDIYDAFAALWTAERIQSGVAQVVPNPPGIDASGIQMGIWY